MAPEQLNVIALISGGKDSFFSILHCQRNGHRVVALANLYPGPEPGDPTGTGAVGEGPESSDLNSFMYQTVGHQIIPLYAAATGLPLYRQPIAGGARDEGRDYDAHDAGREKGKGEEATDGKGPDETESMVPLLQSVMAAHPEANALCAGAILSTYQRTRVESVALRLGLTPLAYLWKYPVLPPPHGTGGESDDAQLLLDMAAAGLDARIVKVASAGLDEDFLWQRASSAAGVSRIKRALRRFGLAEGSTLGEGGEFETIVVDGPGTLFKNRVLVEEGRWQIVREGGGTSWLSLRGASVGDKEGDVADEDDEASRVRVPDNLDPRFQSVSAHLSENHVASREGASSLTQPGTALNTRHREEEQLQQHYHVSGQRSQSTAERDIYWTVSRSSQDQAPTSTEDETRLLVSKIRSLLSPPSSTSASLPTTAIVSTVIVLRRMSDFPAVNAIYGALFEHPNPPSRVTIASGDLLPEGSNVLIHLAVRPNLGSSDRQGLHVQSRSYWAPANIGPYSQAISVPLFDRSAKDPDNDTEEDVSRSSSVRCVSVAGQIPLWPASMTIPPEAQSDVAAQVTMSLQHLWRIGVDQKVQLWTGAVAYFPRTPSAEEMRRRAILAARAWEHAHLFGADEDGDDDEDDDDEQGPDLWDRKYNSEFMTFGGGDGTDRAPSLPDWSVVKKTRSAEDGGGGGVGNGRVGPFFAVEVEELPRGSGVEWHAHAGLSGLEQSSVQLVTAGFSSSSSSSGDLHSGRRGSVSHTVVSGLPVRSAVSIEAGSRGQASSAEDLVAAAREAYARSFGTGVETRAVPAPYLVYVDSSQCGSRVPASSGGAAAVPCRSIWSGDGRKQAVVALFGSLSL